MIRITPDQVTPEIRSLFRTDEMLVSRCFSVLDGSRTGGKIFVDNLASPKWAIVREPVDGTLFFGGDMDACAFAQAFSALRQEGDVLVGMPLDDPRLQYLPPDTKYKGYVLEVYDRPIGEGLEPYLCQVPADCTIKRLDRELILRTEWGPGDVASLGGIDEWEKTCFGYVLMHGDEILSEATVGQPGMGLYEPGVFTRKDQRGNGYGTMVMARLIQEIEDRGGRTFWNCDKDNLPSAAMARKLGYRRMREFRCLAWRRLE